MATAHDSTPDAVDDHVDVRRTEALLETGALQSAIFDSANFSLIESNIDALMTTGYIAKPMRYREFLPTITAHLPLP